MKQVPLKVVHLASGDLWAGAEVQLFTLCKYLNFNDYVEVKVILLNHGELADRLLEEGIEVMVFEESKMSSVKFFFKLLTQLKSWKPDILHTHRQKENIIGSIAAKITGIKSIRSVHGAQEFKYSWRLPYKNLLPLLDRVSGNFFQEKIVSVSEDLTEKLLAVYSKNKLVTIENGIDIKALEPHIKVEDELFLRTPIRIGIVGRLVQVKRVDRFIEAANLLTKKSDTDTYRFFIYGDGPLHDEFERQISHAKLGNQIELAGHQHGIHQCMNNLDLLVITSEHEGLPMTLLEAMVIGIPVYSTNVGNIPKVLENGNCGTLMCDHSALAISDIIESCATDIVVLKEKVKRAKERVARHFSADKNANQFKHLYLSCTKKMGSD